MFVCPHFLIDRLSLHFKEIHKIAYRPISVLKILNMRWFVSATQRRKLERKSAFPEIKFRVGRLFCYGKTLETIL